MAISLYQTKNGPKWRVWVYLDGVRLKSKAGFLSQKEAENWEAEQLEIASQKRSASLTNLDCVELATLYLEDMAVRVQPNTWTAKRTTLQRFIKFFSGHFYLEKLKPHDVDRYLHARLSAGNKAANRDIVELKAFINWTIKKQLYDGKNLFALVPKFSEEKFVRHVPTRDDVEKVMAIASLEQQDFLHILLHTGARLSEVCELNWSDIDFENQTLTLYTRKRRGGNREPRRIAMSNSLTAVLQARRNNGAHSTYVFVGRDKQQFTKNSVRLWLPELSKKAGVPHFTAHGIRHYVATKLAHSGTISPFQIQAVLGHQNLSTTENYLQALTIDRDPAEILDD